ncbi:MAG TPA: ABC transporter substrate-binding protein [Actinomycetota bacterium]|nr:ABC transporter substrate-binding protein [Actinomycetota bacterium]
MRKLLVGWSALLVALLACAPQDQPTIGGGQATETASPGATAAQCAERNRDAFEAPGALTIGTGNPAFPPWFEGGTGPGSEFELNDPANGEGYESAVAYAVAEEMGFTPPQVVWVPVGFNKSFAPGPKPFDFVLQQISYTPERAQAVDFSESYYDVSQAVVATEDSPIAGATTVAELKDATLGAPIGTTSLAVINEVVQPTAEPAVYDDLAGAIQDLKAGTIDGVVVDLPSAFYITAVQLPKGVIVGQFPRTGGEQEYFAMAFEKGSPLVECVNLALRALKEDGTLERIEQEWLADKADAPVLQA